MSGYKYSIDNVRVIKPQFKDILEEYIKNYPASGFMFNHSEFLKEWILNNELNFDDFEEIIKLIELTKKYFYTKNENNIMDGFFANNGTLDKNKTLSEITDRNIDRMNKIKKDLQNLTINAPKTKLLLEIIDDFISKPTNYIPKKDKRINNVEEIRQYLSAKKIEIEQISTYIKYFQT